MSKFTAMNASLLVRKGEAAPSTVTPLRDNRPAPAPVAKDTAHCLPRAGAARRLMLMLGARDYERLGLIAVKRGTSRHCLAQEAMALYFERLAKEYDCACIGQCRETCAAE